MRNKIVILFILLVPFFANSQEEWKGKFEQLGNQIPTPNSYRNGDGAPGPDYWQQKADYKINVILEEEEKRISGSASIKYHNNSPQDLTYIWLQLDQNRRAPHNLEKLTSTFNLPDSIPGWLYQYYMVQRTTEGGMHITSVTDKKGKPLNYAIENTMMRIELAKPLKSGSSIEFKTAWWYYLNNRMEDRGRSGYEYFPADDNYVFTIAQFYPRMAVYDDFEGWQHKQFLGMGEFALSFGDFEVEINVPADHILMATGALQNASDVLSTSHYKKYKQAHKSYDKPIIIASEDEALEREKTKLGSRKVWQFRAENVRDFAFASSRKFIWDAQAVQLHNKTVLAQSLYPKEGNPLWEKESTKAVINTLKTYSKYSIDYPYPQATSVHAAAIGMEYPMICFNFGRPHKDGSYSDAIKYNMIGVIIHEVGHNFFPMIVNSDERQWGWMDEGINTFLQYRTEQECYDNFPSTQGPPRNIVSYMSANPEYLRPIMTAADNIYSFNLGNNAYGKPATALNILRETILGNENFDHAFKTYSQRWAFKHPKPADFFRSMEDAAGVDLDWFWRGWFFSIDPVDIAIDTVQYFRLNPDDNADFAMEESAPGGPNQSFKPTPISKASKLTLLDTPEPYYWEFLERLDEDALRSSLADKHIYKIKFQNIGGLVMPIIVQFTFESGKTEKINIPAEIWRRNEYTVNKVFVFDEKVNSVVVDPDFETADIDDANGVYPRQEKSSKFDLFKNGDGQ